LGADVIKIEPPEGDPEEISVPFIMAGRQGEESFFFAYNTNKRSITLNIQTHEGQEIFKRLAKTADFVIESFNPGDMDKIGLGYSVLKGVHPRVIMVSITRWTGRPPQGLESFRYCGNCHGRLIPHHRKS